MRYFLFVFLFLFISSNVAHALVEEKIYHEGIERVFFVHVPDNLKEQRNLPALLALHGGGGSAEQFANHIKMEDTANKNGFIVVYPQGTAKRGNMNTWNAYKCCAYANENNIDDVGYISKVIDFITAKYRADPARIYATGHSNGAMMSYRLACELSDKITAIAPNGGQDQLQNCELKRAVPVLHIHGKEDKCAQFYGGEECGGCFQDAFRALGLPVRQNGVSRGQCHPVTSVVKKWADLNKCQPDALITFEKGDVTCSTFSNCKDNAEVTLCAIENAGHTWPGANGSIKACKRRPDGRLCAAWKNQIGATNHDINANQFMWEFFSKYKIK